MKNVFDSPTRPQPAADQQRPDADQRFGITPSFTGLLGWFKPISQAVPAVAP